MSSSPRIPTADENLVRLRLYEYALQRGNEFDDPTSYQSCALEKTAAQQGIREMSTAKVVQYFALYCVYCATNGVANGPVHPDLPAPEEIPPWRFVSGWESTDWDPCVDGWYGVTCEDDKVTQIELIDNFLSGVFPPEIVMLASSHESGAGNLNRLDLFDNPLLSDDGDLSWVGDLGPNMEYLYYGHTGFSDDIPLGLAQLYNLIEYDCSYTLNNGTLPAEPFQNLDKLEYLVLDGNPYHNSTVPREIGLLPNLKYLYISDTLVEGGLSFLEGMHSVVEVWLDSNPYLSDTLSSFIGNLTSLVSLSLTDNNLIGELPVEIANLRNLTRLWLYGNNFIGKIPSEYGALHYLEILRLEDNYLSGDVPIEICMNRGLDRALDILGADCGKDVNCMAFFPDCASCFDRESCGGDDFEEYDDDEDYDDVDDADVGIELADNSNVTADDGTEEGGTEEGTEEDGTEDDGVADDGTVDNGAVDNGAVDNGAVDNGAEEGGMEEGTGETDDDDVEDDGVADDGVVDVDVADDGVVDDGVVDEGVAEEGGAEEGGVEEGDAEKSMRCRRGVRSGRRRAGCGD